MKKFFNFILSFIAPNKMETHRDMNVFISILIFLACAIMIAGIPSLTVTKIVKERYLTECYCFEDNLNAELVGEKDLAVFELKADNSIKYVDSASEEGKSKVRQLTFKTPNDKTINLTVVYQIDKTRNDELDSSVFDLDAYLSEIPYEGHTLKSQDILVIYTNQIFYYIFNHGYTLNYQSATSDNIEDYHYLQVPTWENEGNWSLYQTELDEDGNIRKDVNGNIIYKTRLNEKEEEVKIYQQNINKIFTNGKQTNIGMYSYLELEELGINVLDLRELNPLNEYADTVISTCVTSIKTTSYILSVFFNVVLPLLWVFVMWLLLHKNGELTRFKEYYAIAATSMILPAIITSIVGLFIPYTIIARFAFIVNAVFYLTCVLIINNMGRKAKNLQQQNAKKDDEPIEIQEVETKPINEYNETEEGEKPGTIG